MRVEAKLENLAVIADFISMSMSQLCGVTDAFEVQIAVDEACTNIIEYAYSDGKGIITISCELRGDDLFVTIRDRGKPFDPASVSPPDLKAGLNERKVGGLGIYLMRRLMDDVSYSFDAKQGNTLVMRKNLICKRSNH